MKCEEQQNKKNKYGYTIKETFNENGRTLEEVMKIAFKDYCIEIFEKNSKKG